MALSYPPTPVALPGEAEVHLTYLQPDGNNTTFCQRPARKMEPVHRPVTCGKCLKHRQTIQSGLQGLADFDKRKP